MIFLDYFLCRGHLVLLSQMSIVGVDPEPHEFPCDVLHVRQDSWMVEGREVA